MTIVSAHNARIVDQHNRQAPEYARLTASLAEDRSAPFRALIAPMADDRALDIACGPGLLSIGLAPHVAEVVGFDLTPGMLAEARNAQALAGIGNVEWVEGDAADLPFPDASFSLVVSSAAFHHFEQPGKVLREMARVCRPGGRIAVRDVTPAAGKADAYDRLEIMRDPSHRHAHSVAELIALGRAAGLGEPIVESASTGGISFDGVLATSQPDYHSKDEIRALVEQDALTGEDHLGLQAHFAEGRLMALYTMSSLLWHRP